MQSKIIIHPNRFWVSLGWVGVFWIQGVPLLVQNDLQAMGMIPKTGRTRAILFPRNEKRTGVERPSPK